MTTTLACLDETELLALAMGEAVAAAITAHLGGCALCRRRLDRLQAEVASLRQNHGQGTTPGSTEHPEAAHDAEAPNAGATMDWKSSERPGAHNTDRFGPEAVAAARAAAEGEDAMPDTIGRYKVVGWLGYGGEADVYRVVHIKLGNDLVLKLSHRRVGADSQSRLVEQGRLLVDLEHPNLVRELTVRVWSPNEGGKRGLKIEEPGALPLLAGEKVRLEAHLNQPAHVYLLWLDGQGKVSQLYPRDDRKYGSQPSRGAARDTVESPAALDEGHPMKGAGGLETVLLLARRTPLAEGTNLAGLIGPLSPSPLRNELEIAKRGGDEGQPIVTLNVNMNRSIDDETAKIDDPLLQLMERLRTQYQFDVIKAVRFAYRGE